MKTKTIIMLVLLGLLGTGRMQAQTQEAIQLGLNLEKLRQLEAILDNMYKGYKILTKGYNTIKDIAEGNFKVHQVFLDALYAVNPAVRNYKRIPYIIQYQQHIMREGRCAYDRFRNDENLTLREIRYLESVYSHIFQQSLRNLDELITITTAAKLRMSDEERLRAVDRIYMEMENRFIFLKLFNDQAEKLAVQRAREQNSIHTLRKLHGVNP